MLIGSKIAAGALAAGTLAVGGTTAAAYTGVLPAPIQSAAHDIIGAPAPSELNATATDETQVEPTPEPEDSVAPEETVDPSPEPTEPITESIEPAPEESEPAGAKGPDAPGSSAYGLCAAFNAGGLAASSTTFTSLVTAAGSEENISAYCADVESPGQGQKPANAGRP